MRGSKSKNTKPELIVRQALRQIRTGYRLHRKDLPGKPDIAFIGLRKAIFVHGCFWHQHDADECPISRKPESNSNFWQAKFAATKKRDEQDKRALLAKGWDILEVWECQLGEPELSERLSNFLA